MINLKNKNSGLILVNVLVFGVIAIIVTTSLVNWAAVMLKNTKQLSAREQAIQIAEAGIDYYRWHLAHAPNDYKDGTATTTNGPFVHDFEDKDGNVIGQFSLTITPPPTGSTLIKIKSTGTVLSDPGLSRSIQVSLAIPSLARFAMVTNSVVYYGAGEEIFGPIHSNNGVGFLSGNPAPRVHNLVTSALSTFNPGGGLKLGVYTSVPTADPNPTTTVAQVIPNRPDVFMGGRQFPVAVVDFTSITSDLSGLKTQAQSAGFYRASSGGNGYRVVLKVNDTFDLYKINSLLPAPGGCTNSQNQTGWGTWSINTTGGATTLLGNYPFPSNGIMFFEDHVWVEGQIDVARLTIAAGVFPVNASTYKNIIVNNNLLYTNFDGSDAIGLIAQGDFLVGLSSANSLTIDGALIAQNGSTRRYYYNSSCGTGVRNTLTTYGMFGSNGQGYFSYGTNVSGYNNQPATYDANFLYAPPPNFPLTSSQYSILSWEEVK
jgi:type II secretory pathway pseudopilin PulG